MGSNRSRRALGLFMLACVVVFWTASSFLLSSMFADATYSKPYLVTYFNTSFFSSQFVLWYIKQRLGWGRRSSIRKADRYRTNSIDGTNDGMSASSTLLGSESPSRSSSPSAPTKRHGSDGKLSMELEVEAVRPMSIRETFWLASRFCPLWFTANWMNSASFEHTSVASSTILVSTSSVFTLLIGAAMGVEKFTLRKVTGVAASLAGVILISTVDTSGTNDQDDLGSFPYKAPGEIAVGDGMALLSAVVYGLYASLLSKHVGGEGPGSKPGEGPAREIDMQLFFGCIGVVCALSLWPGIPLLAAMGFEYFELPPAGKVSSVLLLNAVVSLASDMCWANAVLLTSPVIVTVGLTLTIPLSLIGQMILNSQYTGALYWVGAAIVVASFVFVSYEPTPPSSSSAVDVAPGVLAGAGASSSASESEPLREAQ